MDKVHAAMDWRMVMFVLVTGGSASGKSSFAEGLICRLWDGPKIYLATMQPFGEEGKERVRRHRTMRFGRGFVTKEEYGLFRGGFAGKQDGVLLECISNYICNYIFSPKGLKGVRGKGPEHRIWEEQAAERLADSVLELAEETGFLAAVTCEVFSDGLTYEEGTESFRRVLADVNRRLSGAADCVWEVVCGIPVLLKGENLCV